MHILQSIYRIAACCLVITAGACNKKETLTKTEDNRLYHLPQGDQPYDQEIMDFYKEYNVVILYKFSDLDFGYSPNGANPRYVTATQAEPGQVQESLDFLHEQWFDLYDKSFLKQALPFKILLASNLVRVVPPNQGEDQGTTYPVAVKGFNHVTFGRAGRISTMTAADKDTARGMLQKSFWHLATLNRLVELPPAFVALMPDYTLVHAWYPNRHGVFKLYSGITHFDDFADYINVITSTDYTTLTNTLFKPARDPNGMFRKKYDAIVQYYLQKYNIDLQAIGNL
jgi:hypothetical protein